MSINWKKEGYKVGENALVVLRKYNFTRNEFEFTDYKVLYEITHVGTKILKVKHKDYHNNTKFQFKSRSINGPFFGHSYVVFKDEEEFNLYKQKEERYKELRIKLSEKVKTLPIEKLEMINDIIENS